MCNRPLNETAVPGLQIGPKCAKDRGLLPGRPDRRLRARGVAQHRTHHDIRQIDWITTMNAGVAGERVTT